MRILRAFIGTAVGLTLVAVSPAQAQQAANSSHPWAAFYGCWAPTEGARNLAATCVLPVDGSPFAIEQLSVVAGNVLRSASLRADAVRREIDAEGCEGWESASFSVDGARVYTRGSATCADGAEQLTSAVLSITPEGQFLQVAAVRVGEQRTVTTQRFALLPWVEVPPALQSRLAAFARIAEGARTRAALPLDLDRLEDALQFADAYVVEAWMAETGTGESDFRVTRRELERLVAMKAPTRVIDLSVALANPAQFAPRVERASGGANTWGTSRQQAWLGNDLRLDAFCDQVQLGMMNWRGGMPLWSMFPGMGLLYYGALSDCMGRGFYSRWDFGPYPYGRDGYVGGWFGPSAPVVVVTTPRRPPGTVTKGQGYTRGTNSTSSGGSGQTRNNSGPSTVRASSGSGQSSSSGESSSGGTRSAGSNGTGRTAQPRNPQ